MVGAEMNLLTKNHGPCKHLIKLLSDSISTGITCFAPCFITMRALPERRWYHDGACHRGVLS